MRLAFVVLLAACQGDGAPPAPVNAVGEVSPSEEIVVVGTGAMQPLAIELAAAWRAAGGVPRVVVEPSVGSGGGIRAAAEGAVDLGMISRPLSAREAQLGLLVRPVARDAVVIAANRSVGVDGLTRAEIVELYAGRLRRFSDGSEAVLLLRDPQESANLALERVLPSLTALRQEATLAGRTRVLYHDDAMGQALATTPGAVGVFDLGAIVAGKLPLKALALDGVVPSVEALSDERWPVVRELAFVARPDRQARVAPFLAFVASDEGRRIARACGYAVTP
jgi:phosphate transport system substrate-binding protein